LLGNALHKTSDACHWLTVGFPENQRRLVKPYSKLQAVKDKTESVLKHVYEAFVPDHYPQRSDYLEDRCLWDVFRKYGPRRHIGKPPPANRGQPWAEGMICMLKDGTGYLHKRERPLIIDMFCQAPKSDNDKEEFFAKILQLFIPYRRYEELKEGYNTYEEAFNTRSEDPELARMVKFADEKKAYWEEAKKYAREQAEFKKEMGEAQSLSESQMDDSRIDFEDEAPV
jgi:hypothetical protein